MLAFAVVDFELLTKITGLPIAPVEVPQGCPAGPDRPGKGTGIMVWRYPKTGQNATAA